MPLGAARLNTLSRVLTVAEPESTRTSTAKTVTLFDDAVISTAQAKFGASSVLLDGTADGVHVAHADLQIGGGDFTIEFFFYPTSIGSDDYVLDCGSGFSGKINWFFDTATTYKFRSGPTTILSGNHGLSTNSWQHIAISRASGTIKYFLDGVEQHSASNSTTFSSSQFKIGTYSTGGPYGLLGYIDEYRVSNSARYTSGFTPTTSAFVGDENTDLLLHFDGINGSKEGTDDPPHNDLRAIDPNNSYYLDGTVSSNSTDSEDVTVSCWFKHTSGTDLNPIMSATYSHPTDFFIIEYQGGRFRITFSNDGATPRGGDYQFGTYSASYGSGTYDDGAWHHVVLSRDSSASTVVSYVDGVSTTAGYINQDFSKKGFPGNRFTDISFLTHLAISDSRIAGTGFQVAQLFVDNVFYDITDSTVREKFYNGGAINMGSNGTASGLDQPLVFHFGDTNDFELKGGDTTAFPYTVTQSGTGVDISSTNGPQSA